MGNQTAAVPTRDDPPDLWSEEARFVLKDPDRVTGQRQQARHRFLTVEGGWDSCIDL
jgi:hypothetical protein